MNLTNCSVSFWLRGVPAIIAAMVLMLGSAQFVGADEPDSDGPATTLPPENTDLPVTEPPVTDLPVTEPPVTDLPVTEPPVTDLPVTEPPVTNPPVTEPPVTNPPMELPGRPQGVSASAGDGGAQVSWQAPSSGGPVWKYTVQISSGDGKWAKATYTDGSARSAHVGGLRSGVRYFFRVVAWNEAGFGEVSSQVSVDLSSGEAGDHPGRSAPESSEYPDETPDHPDEHPAPGQPGHPEHPLPDVSSLPGPMPSDDDVDIGTQVYAPQYLDGVGAFRINCTYSHLNFDDPMTMPGEPGAAHLHVYFGNDSVDAYSTAESIAASGGSTCTGGTANRSAYWAPAIVDADGQAVVSTDSNALQVYYKTGYRGVDTTEVVNFPAGLRMIAGDADGTTAGDLDAVWYTCLSDESYDRSSSFPDCGAGDTMVMTVQFPQCWDGVNLDSADHQSHMAYANPGSGCPSSHPVPLPEITQNFRYLVPAGGMNGWRLSSDMYDGPPGYSGHADWWNGWDAEIFQRVIDNCYAQGLDCRMNNLGDGTRLE